MSTIDVGLARRGHVFRWGGGSISAWIPTRAGAVRVTIDKPLGAATLASATYWLHPWRTSGPSFDPETGETGAVTSGFRITRDRAVELTPPEC